MKKLILALALLFSFTTTYSQVMVASKQVQPIGTYYFSPINATDTSTTTSTKTFSTDIFGIDVVDSIAFVVEYQITDSIQLINSTTGPIGYSGQALNWSPFNDNIRWVNSGYFDKIKDTIRYAVAQIGSRINTTSFSVLTSGTTISTGGVIPGGWILSYAPTVDGTHISQAYKLPYGITKLRLNISIGYSSNATTGAKFPASWMGRTIRATIYKITR